MNLGFWKKLKKPIFVLAPMANVTDVAFRKIITKYGKPDVFFTEFVSADGLASSGREKLLVDFWYEENQRPIVAQIFGSKPENIFKAAQLVKELKFDGLDINMGCPDRAVLKQNAGGALIKNPKLAQEIILAAKEGSGLPVSVKTRIGFSKSIVEEWLPALANMDLAAITVHLRTVKEMSDVPAHWDMMPQIVALMNERATDETRPLILGNGDILSLTDAEEKCAQTGADGIMLGRVIFGNLWLFSKDKIATSLRSSQLRVMLEHTFLFEKMFKGIKNFDIMKKHYKAYVTGFDGAKELRTQLMNAKNATEVYKIIRQHYPKLFLPRRIDCNNTIVLNSTIVLA